MDVLRILVQVAPASVRCVYIDPPYNNQEEYNHYTDKLDHDEWLDDVTQRLKYLSQLLTADGSIWISIDDRELHYLKVAADNIFGRENFVATIVWQQRTSRENRKVFSNNHEYVLVYAKNARAFHGSRNPLPYTDDVRARYRNPDNDPRGSWQSISANVQAGHATPTQFYTITGPSGRLHTAPEGRCWVFGKERMEVEIAENNIWFGQDGNGVPRLKKFLSTNGHGLTPETFWPASDVTTTKAAKKHLLQMFPRERVFDTPKPEHLIHRILHIATSPGDLVLDAYLGSGTTAAVAHKMARRYIGIEKGRHSMTLCAKRLRQVVKGEAGGISRLVNWTGGGGFDFYKFSR